MAPSVGLKARVFQRSEVSPLVFIWLRSPNHFILLQKFVLCSKLPVPVAHHVSALKCQKKQANFIGQRSTFGYFAAFCNNLTLSFCVERVFQRLLITQKSIIVKRFLFSQFKSSKDLSTGLIFAVFSCIEKEDIVK